jgi:very-short-patch-repair endonuclease
VPEISAAAAHLFRLQHGNASRAQLRDAGMSDDQIDRATQSGIFELVQPGIARLAAAPLTARSELIAPCLVDPGGVVVSHHSAGRLHGLRRLGPDRRVHVTIAGSRHLRLRGIVLHRSHAFATCDIEPSDDGLWATSPLRTAFDLAWQLSDGQLESVIEQLLDRRLCQPRDLWEIVHRLGRSGRRGTARWRRVLESRPQAEPLDSDLEVRFEQAIRAAGLPAPVRHAAVELPTGEIIHPDFYWPANALAVEVDHPTWHGGRTDRERDSRRDRLLRSIGIEVRRVLDAELLDPATLREVVRDIARRLRTSRPA